MRQYVPAIKFVGFGNGLDEVSIVDPIDVLDYSTIEASSFDLTANKIYKLGTKDALTITFLEPEDETKGAIFNCSFVAGSSFTEPTFYKEGSATAITIDKGTLAFVPGTKYEVSYNWASEILIVQ